MKRIKEDISNNNFKRVYLLCGDETYLRNQYRDNLMNALTTDGDTMNVLIHRGKNVPIGEIIDFAETMPFLASKRVVLIEDSGLLNQEGEIGKLTEYISEIPETTCIIFSEEDFNKKSELYKAIDKVGYVAEFKRLGSDDLRKWVMSKIKKEDLSITGQALDEFLAGTGDDMLNIQSELEKLISYAYGTKGIRLEDVQAVCTPKLEDKIFDMLNFIFVGRADMALDIYGDLLALQDTPAQIMAMIERQLKLMIHAKGLKREQLSLDEMKKILYPKSKSNYGVTKLLQQADKKSTAFLKKWLNICADTEVDSRTGKLDSQIGLELIIISMANESRM